MKHFAWKLLFLLLLVQVQPALAQTMLNSPWRAQYYDNPYLAGTPVLDRFENRVGVDWGTGAPDASMPADNFSVRWGKGGYLAAGTYRFILTADEGVRVYVDGVVILDTWDEPRPGTTIGTDLFLAAGDHQIQIDYREFADRAYIFLDWGLAPGGQAQPQPSVAEYGTVTVLTPLLNVRSEARIANNIIARVEQGQQFRELSRSEDGRWVQISLGNNTTGWVSSAYVIASTVTSDQLNGNVLQANARLLVRTAPDSGSDVIGLLLVDEVVPIVARNADLTWWQINDNGKIGWVNGVYVTLSPTLNAVAIPVAP